MDVTKQEEVDKLMLELDGTDNKSNLTKMFLMFGGVGGRTRANLFFGRSERPKNIGTDQFFLGSFSGRT